MENFDDFNWKIDNNGELEIESVKNKYYNQKSEIEIDFSKLWYRVFDFHGAMNFDCSLFNTPTKRYIILDCIVLPVSKRKNGKGTEIMQELIDYANTYQLAIYLRPADIFGTPIEVLLKFYKKLGFVPSNRINAPLDYIGKGALVKYPNQLEEI